MEVVVGVDDGEAAAVRQFLGGFQQVPTNEEVAQRAVSLRREHQIRLPDAIIWASSARSTGHRRKAVLPQQHL